MYRRRTWAEDGRTEVISLKQREHRTTVAATRQSKAKTNLGGSDIHQCNALTYLYPPRCPCPVRSYVVY